MVLDVSKSMVGGKSPTRLDTAARALDLFVQQKVRGVGGGARRGGSNRARCGPDLTPAAQILFAKKDSVGIVLVGTEGASHRRLCA